MEVFNKITRHLDKLGIEYKVSIHEPVITSAQAAEIRGTDATTGAKALIVKTPDDLKMLVLPGNKKIDWKKARKAIGVNKLSLADATVIEDKFGIKIGGFPPLGNLLGLDTYFEESLLENEMANFNAGLRTHSISMEMSDLVKAVEPTLTTFIIN